MGWFKIRFALATFARMKYSYQWPTFKINYCREWRLLQRTYRVVREYVITGCVCHCLIGVCIILFRIQNTGNGWWYSPFHSFNVHLGSIGTCRKCERLFFFYCFNLSSFCSFHFTSCFLSLLPPSLSSSSSWNVWRRRWATTTTTTTTFLPFRRFFFFISSYSGFGANFSDAVIAQSGESNWNLKTVGQKDQLIY